MIVQLVAPPLPALDVVVMELVTLTDSEQIPSEVNGFHEHCMAGGGHSIAGWRFDPVAEAMIEA